MKRLLEDFRSLLLTLSPQTGASPLLAAHQVLDGASPSCAAGRLAGHKARDTAAIERSVPLPPFAAWPGFPGPGTWCRPVTVPDRSCCRTAAVWRGAPEGRHSPRGPQLSCIVGHQRSGGTGQADTKPGSLLHERREKGLQGSNGSASPTL